MTDEQVDRALAEARSRLETVQAALEKVSEDGISESQEELGLTIHHLENAVGAIAVTRHYALSKES